MSSWWIIVLVLVAGVIGLGTILLHRSEAAESRAEPPSLPRPRIKAPAIPLGPVFWLLGAGLVVAGLVLRATGRAGWEVIPFLAAVVVAKYRRAWKKSREDAGDEKLEKLPKTGEEG